MGSSEDWGKKQSGDRMEVRVAGFGGQGVILAGVLLGTAVTLYEGKKAVQTQSYGAAARGGAARSDIIISSQPIIYPQTTHLDILVAMSQEAAGKYIKDLKQTGTLIIDEDLVNTDDLGRDRPAGENNPHKIPASRIAVRDLKRNVVANLIMIGFMMKITKLITLGSMEKAIRSVVPAGTEELNLAAFHRGYNWSL